LKCTHIVKDVMLGVYAGEVPKTPTI